MTFNSLAENNGLAIEITDLQKSYSKKTVLKDLNLSIPAGQFVAVVGRSGCGKSTLLRLLANLAKPTSGKILVNNDNLLSSQNEIRLMFQEDRLLPWRTIGQNVEIGLQKKQQSFAKTILNSVGLSERYKDWPSTLSGGQKQRVALARALIHKPKLLLLDETLGALDALTRIEMQKLIERFWIEQGFTVLLVTHDVNESVMMADRVIVIEQGKIGYDIEIDIPRPRRRNDPKISEFEVQILEKIFTHD